MVSADNPCKRINGVRAFTRSVIFFFCQGIEDFIGIDHPVKRGLELTDLIITEQFNFRIFQLSGAHTGGNFRKFYNRAGNAAGEEKTPHNDNRQGNEREDKDAGCQAYTRNDAFSPAHGNDPEKQHRDHGNKEHAHHKLIENGDLK